MQSGAYTKAIKKADAKAKVIERACTLFVPLAEEGWADNEVARMIAETYLQDLRASIDTLVPWLWAMNDSPLAACDCIHATSSAAP